MTRVLLPSPSDKALLLQLPRLYREMAALGERLTGQPDPLVPDEAAVMDRWLARTLTRDPDFLVALAVDDQRVTGGVVAELNGQAVEVLLSRSAARPDGTSLLRALLAWARACGARYILGGTFRNPEAYARRVGFRHVRDEYLLEVS